MMHYSFASLDEVLNALDGERCYPKVSAKIMLIGKCKIYRDKEE